jgi:hypothetical protein
MELPMHHALTRNRTFDAITNGRYSNIRFYKHNSNQPGHARFDDDFLWIQPPPEDEDWAADGR